MNYGNEVIKIKNGFLLPNGFRKKKWSAEKISKTYLSPESEKMTS